MRVTRRKSEDANHKTRQRLKKVSSLFDTELEVIIHNIDHQNFYITTKKK